MSNCKYCQKPIESNTGRRPRLYCNDGCKNAYFNANKKPVASQKVWRVTYDAALSQIKALEARIRELESGNPVTERNGDNKKQSEQSVQDPPENPIQQEIDKLQKDLALVTGKSSFANDMRKSIEKKIAKLEKELYKTN